MAYYTHNMHFHSTGYPYYYTGFDFRTEANITSHFVFVAERVSSLTAIRSPSRAMCLDMFGALETKLKS